MNNIPQDEIKVYVYGLHNGDGVIRYVGATKDLQRRTWDHKRASYDWLNSQALHVKVLAEVDEKDSRIAEQRAILKHQDTIVNQRQATRKNALSEQEHQDMLSAFFDSIGE